MNNGTYLFEVICPSLVCPAANIRVSKETSSSKRGTFQTHSNRRREYIQRPHWRRTLLRSLLEPRFQIYNHIFINVNSPSIYANTQINSNLVTVAASLGLFPKAHRWLLDAYLVLDLLQQIALIHEQNRHHLRQLRREADRLPRTNESSRRLTLLATVEAGDGA
jgi:hypothetical protein